jgi:hypothetical protein
MLLECLPFACIADQNSSILTFSARPALSCFDYKFWLFSLATPNPNMISLVFCQRLQHATPTKMAGEVPAFPRPDLVGMEDGEPTPDEEYAYCITLEAGLDGLKVPDWAKLIVASLFRK